MIYLLLRVLRIFPPETSSKISLQTLKFLHELFPKFFRNKSKKYFYPQNKLEILNLNFPNKIGISAGLDKEGKYFSSIGSIGFGFIEIGTFTPRPQEGNPYPRIKRINSEQSIVNKLGFNNPGIIEGIKNLKINKHKYLGIVGVSIGKNKDTPLDEAIKDYLFCLEESYYLADYIAINISSPNTKDLRLLSEKQHFSLLIEEIMSAKERLRLKHNKETPFFVKISPDEDLDHLEHMIEVSVKLGISGLIVCNTTLGEVENFKGGISGKLLKEKSLAILETVNILNNGRLVIISCGGIFDKTDLNERSKLGADLFQLYTSFVFEGPKILDKLI
tara:strand:+ start:794 stop:1789 length:996 start_codon:yes stop_codon:yes gene_type:complete